MSTSTLDRIAEAFVEGCSPTEDLLPSQWAEKYRIVSSEATGATMSWRNDLAPYMVEPMDTFHPSCPSEITVIQKPIQVAASESMNNLIGWIAHQEKKSQMILLPTIEVMETYSDLRLKTMIRDTPALAAIVSDNSRDETNKKLLKMYPGGFMKMAGANSSASLQSHPVKYLLNDEMDEWPEECEGSSPFDEAKKRTDRYPDHKIWMSARPRIKQFSIICDYYERSSQGLFNVPCLLCGSYQPLLFDHLIYKDRDSPAYECDSCNRLFDDAQKYEILLNGKWVHRFPDNWKIRGYFLNGLYSPAGWFNTWQNMADEWIDAMAKLKQRNKKPLITFKQTRLAEAVEYNETQDDEPDVEEIQKRCEVYPEYLPNAIKVVTCFFDIQDTWVEYETIGWGAGKENWSLEIGKFEGSPGVPETDGVWLQMDLYIQKTFIRQDGTVLNISVTGVDSGGHFTEEVYKFCKNRFRRGVVATKGYNVAGKPLITRGQSKDGKLIYMIGTETAKDTVYTHLAVPQPGPGYCHFPKRSEYDEEYFKQIFAEEAKMRMRNGRRVRVYVSRRKRNEKLDLRVGNYVALELADPRYVLINAESAQPKPKPTTGRRQISSGVE